MQIEGRFPRVAANEAALTQCVSNLLGNAVKFVAPGVIPHVRVWAEQHGEQVRVFFQDNGIGIEKEAHEKIFTIFQRLSNHYEGTGVGLAIVQRIVHRHGGRVWAESRPGEGATFYFTVGKGAGS